ncbi:hypothetical protein GY45DRAFT_592801 [Cubamyces sp. BRFM 1775]|nr:hypothetical protein GY45DRAFT_592801 [Cubamyces sp. BRFM 1775]
MGNMHCVQCRQDACEVKLQCRLGYARTTNSTVGPAYVCALCILSLCSTAGVVEPTEMKSRGTYRALGRRRQQTSFLMQLSRTGRGGVLSFRDVAKTGWTLENAEWPRPDSHCSLPRSSTCQALFSPFLPQVPSPRPRQVPPCAAFPPFLSTILNPAWALAVSRHPSALR